MRVIQGTVWETLVLKKTVVVEVEDNAEEEDIELAMRREALKRTIICPDHGWEIEGSNGIDVEVEEGATWKQRRRP